MIVYFHLLIIITAFIVANLFKNHGCLSARPTAQKLQLCYDPEHNPMDWNMLLVPLPYVHIKTDKVKMQNNI